MQKKALVVIDIQNDITKNYKEIIGNINRPRSIGRLRSCYPRRLYPA